MMYRRVLEVHPSNARAGHLMGLLAYQMGRNDDAIEFITTAIKIDRFNAVFHADLAEIYRALGKLPEAIAACHEALKCDPGMAAVHNCLGQLHQAQDRPSEAIACYRQAVDLDGKSVSAHANLGAALRSAGELAEAQAMLQRAVQLAPNQPDNYLGLGVCLYDLGQDLDAIACYQKAIRLKPDLAKAHFNCALARLAMGDFANGWREFETRHSFPELVRRRYLLPMWSADESPARGVLIHAEQGLGDTLQFIRYVPLVAQRAARVVVDVHEELIPLLSQSGYGNLISDGVVPQDCERQLPLMSAPRVLGTTLGSIPQAVPYLSAREELVATWREKLAALGGFRVGVHWQGRRTYYNDHARSIPLKHFEPLAKMAGVQLVSLQKKEGTEQLAEVSARFTVHDLGPELDEAAGAFMDTAAVIRNLDLVITSDSAVAHLAGGLGAPVWVALPVGSDWRWLRSAPTAPGIRRCDCSANRRRARGARYSPRWPPSSPSSSWRGLREPDDTSTKGHNHGRTRQSQSPASHGSHAHHRRSHSDRDRTSASRAAGRGRTDLSPGAGGRAAPCGALHLLGLVALQAGSADSAVEFISQAIRLDGGRAAFHGNLGEAFRALGRLDDARLCYEQALRLDPSLAAAHNNLGTILQAQGKLDQAIVHYRAAADLMPHYADAHNNLGTAYQDQGQWTQAIASYRRAVEVAPAYPKGHYNLGVAYQAMGQNQLARDAMRRAVALADNYAEAHHALARMLQQDGNLDAAESHLRRAIELQPSSAEAHCSLGLLHQARGKPGEAIAEYTFALGLRPQYAEAHYNWGTVLAAQNQLADAATRYRQAIACKPDMADAHYNLGTVLQKLNRLDEAAGAYREAVRIRPDFVLALNNLGNVHFLQDRPDEAIACYERALATNPEHAEALNNLGNVLQARGETAKTVECFERAVRAKPESAEALGNLANVLHLQGHTDRALDYYQRSLRIAPDFAESHHNLALLYLSQGRFAEAWPEFAWRLKCANYPRRVLREPLWHGEDLNGRTLLIHAEQGFGDTLMLLRYVPLVRARGGRVLLEVQPRLVPLLTAADYRDVIAGGSPLPPFDLQIPILNLPGVFGTTVETIPSVVPYLTADPSLVDAWRDKLAPLAGRRVGIGWQGSRGYALDRTRSIALKHFAALAAVAGVQLISLQKTDGREQLSEVAGQFAVHDLGESLDEAGAFVDTAAVMKNLDLVITSDTALAHLAGALGVPVWVALAKVPEWRWLTGRADSPWYPTMRLFRQSSAGDWPEVFTRMADELRERVR